MAAYIGNINKEIFLSSLVCLGYGWELRRRKGGPEPTLAERFRMEQGQEVHRRARMLFPDAVVAAGPDFSASVKRTSKLMENPSTDVILEAAFKVGNYTAIADVLVRDSDGWDLIEIKSRTSKDKDLVDDVAYTCMVLREAEIDILKASAMLVSKEFQLGMSDVELFKTVDMTDEVFARTELFSWEWQLIDDLTSRESQQLPRWSFASKKCPHCYEHFVGSRKNHIFHLPRLSEKKFILLDDLDIKWIKDIPDDFPLTEYQERVVRAVKSGEPIVGSDLETHLERVQFPAGYLDFETFHTAVPEFPDVGPWEHIAIQYSLHTCESLDSVPDHFEYLCDHDSDTRRELLERLIGDCEDLSSIIVYTSFESRILESMKSHFPDLEKPINDILDRLVDLHEILKKSYYHPDFSGSTSIKRTLPVLVPDTSYEGMEIADGSTAMAAFAYLRKGDYSQPEKVRENLLQYCELDSFAMVKIHERLVQESSGIE